MNKGRIGGGVHKKRIYEEIPNPRERRPGGKANCKRKEEIRKKKKSYATLRDKRN